MFLFCFWVDVLEVLTVLEGWLLRFENLASLLTVFGDLNTLGLLTVETFVNVELTGFGYVTGFWLMAV